MCLKYTVKVCQGCGMAKTYRPYLSEQDLLLPPSLRDWLPEGHSCYFVSDVVEQLDLSAIESFCEKEERGYPPYHPRMMVKVLVYGYCVGVFSSRKLQKRLNGFRSLSKNLLLHIPIRIAGPASARIVTQFRCMGCNNLNSRPVPAPAPVAAP